MFKRSTVGRIIRAIIILIIVAALALAGLWFMHNKKADQRADEVIATMRELIPSLGQDTGVSSGNGREQLAVLSIQNIDIVGCIEVPSIDVMAPVTAAGFEEAGFATFDSGSAVKGQLRLTGSRLDVFADISSCKPGDRVIFTDIDGVRYTYEVTTQFHLKNWDEADYDLMLSYRSDPQTHFVLGCTRTS